MLEKNLLQFLVAELCANSVLLAQVKRTIKLKVVSSNRQYINCYQTKEVFFQFIYDQNTSQALYKPGNCYLCSQQNQAKFYFFGCLEPTITTTLKQFGNISLVFQFKIRVSLLNWHSRHIVSQILDSISLHSKHQMLRIKQNKQL